MNILYSIIFLIAYASFKVECQEIFQNANNLCTCTEEISICNLPCNFSSVTDDLILNLNLTPVEKCEPALLIRSVVSVKTNWRCKGTAEDVQGECLHEQLFDKSVVILDFPENSNGIVGAGFCMFGSKVCRKKWAKIE